MFKILSFATKDNKITKSLSLVKQTKPKTPKITKRPSKRPSDSENLEENSPCKKVGRPRIEFDGERAKNLISLGFTMSQVSNALGISDGTLRRFRTIESCNLYDKISDEELDKEVLDIKKQHPGMGEKRLLGLLRGRGLRIQRSRLRDCIHRVDPSGPKLRCNAGILLVNSRTSVGENREAKPKLAKGKREANGIQVPVNCPAPNSIWRIDTMDKLERWKISITFALDMFSRMMVFMVASNVGDNHQENIEDAFRSSVKMYQWPDLLSTDEKDEKMLVWKAMIEEKGDLSVEMSSKLERVQWVTIIKNDLNNSILTPLLDTFTQLEIEGSLNVENDTDLFCLHFVYLPRINKLLKDFACCYNACCIPHGNGATPSQIFYAHNEQISDNTKDILPSLINKENFPEVSLLTIAPIQAEKFQELKDHVNPLDDSSDNGKEIYYRTGTFVTQCLKAVIEEINYTTTGDHQDLSMQPNSHTMSHTSNIFTDDDVQVVLEEVAPEVSSNSIVVVESDNVASLEENILLKIQEAAKDESMQGKSAQDILETLISQATNVEETNSGNFLTEINGQQVVILDSSKDLHGDNQLPKNLLELDPASLVILNPSKADESSVELQIATQSTINLDSNILTVDGEHVA